MHRETRPGRMSLASVVSGWSSHSDDGHGSHHLHLPHLHHHQHQDDGRTSADEDRRSSLAPPPSHALQRGRQASTCSERSCEGMSRDETRELWRCMLELQLRYGCYTSARIDMALDAGEEGDDLMPNRFIIDTLNESVFDLPDEGREMLNRYLSPGSAASSPSKQKWKLWKK